MAVDAPDGRSVRVPAVLRRVVAGEDGRLRATWRVLLAVPLFWYVAGGVAGTIQAEVELLPAGPEPFGGLTQSVLHALLFTVVLVGWARYLDRRPLSRYGVKASPHWVLDVAVGLAAVLASFGAWYGLGVAMGWTSLAVDVSVPEGSVLGAFGLPLATFGLHVAVQQVLFFGVVLVAAAEGLHSRGVTRRRAVLGGTLVSVAAFVAIHDLSSWWRVVDLAVAGGVFALLYALTEEVALGIGAHLGVTSAGVVFATGGDGATGASLVAVTQSLPAALEPLGAYGFPKLVLAALLAAAWIALWTGELSVERPIARRPRG